VSEWGRIEPYQKLANLIHASRIWDGQRHWMGQEQQLIGKLILFHNQSINQSSRIGGW
jgi:hypothetical protein